MAMGVGVGVWCGWYEEINVKLILFFNYLVKCMSAVKKIGTI